MILWPRIGIGLGKRISVGLILTMNLGVGLSLIIYKIIQD